jgi:hypothetical protein
VLAWKAGRPVKLALAPDAPLVHERITAY